MRAKASAIKDRRSKSGSYQLCGKEPTLSAIRRLECGSLMVKPFPTGIAIRACVILAASVIGGCSNAGPGFANHPMDCAIGVPWSDCLPGTAGYRGPSSQVTETLAAASEQHQADVAACQATFSESNKEAIARAKCFNEADAKYNSTTRYPDLINLVIAKRTELAERQAAGKITHAQATLELRQLMTQLVSEEQRRNAVANQQNAMAQANNNAAALILLQSMQATRPAPNQLPMPAPPPTTLNTNCQTYGGNTYCQTR